MRILHINTYQTGGAALCMQRIGKALQQHGVECRYLLMQGTENEYTSIAPGDTDIWSKRIFLRFFQKIKYIIGVKPKFIRFRLKLEHALATNKDRIFATLPISCYKSIISHPWFQEADIIHLHWIGNFVDFPYFFKTQKQIVWTLHDLNPLFGCFHYADSVNLSSTQLLDIEKECIEIKRKSLSTISNIHIVAISEQMKRLIRQNPRLKKYPLTLINNGVDTSNFIHFNKENARKELGLNLDQKVFMFSSHTLEDKHKGLKELISSLETLKIYNSILLCIGAYHNIPNTSQTIKCLGFITDNTLLSKYYSSADFFVMPSFQEGFAQTPLEAMSCGTPVIAFPCSGTEELINNSNGVICKDFTIESLTEGIQMGLSRQYNPAKIRKYIKERFSYEIIANQYKNLYKSILDSRNIEVSNGKFSELDQDQINQQKEEHEKQINLFHQLDAKRDFYKMAITHPRYIAGWFKKKIKSLFN